MCKEIRTEIYAAVERVSDLLSETAADNPQSRGWCILIETANDVWARPISGLTREVAREKVESRSSSHIPPESEVE